MSNDHNATTRSALFRGFDTRLQVCVAPCFKAILWLGFVAALSVQARSQTLAHPGWVGSGMNVERWWRHATLYEVNGGGDGRSTAGDEDALRKLATHMEDVQALGVDAIVVRNPPPVQGASGVRADAVPEGASQLEAFDDLVQQASRRRLRVLVELQPTTQANLAAEARFWLNRGIAGLYLARPSQPAAASAESPGPPAQALREELVALHGILKGFAGERILISEAPADLPLPAEAAEAPAATTPSRGSRHHASSREQVTRPLSPAAGDVELMLVRVADPADGDGPGDPAAGTRAGGVRTSLVGAIASIQRISSTRSSPLIALAGNGEQGPALTATGDAAMGKIEAALLLGTGSSVMIPGRGLTLPDAPAASEPATTASGGTQQPVNPYAAAARAAREAVARDAAAVVARHSLYEWYRRLNALAQGNGTMRLGGITVLNRDSDDVLVWVRTPRGAGPVVVLACNLSARPVTFSLLEDLRRLHLRGSFLRTMLRSDDAMGPMSLGAVALAPHAVYIGQLSR